MEPIVILLVIGIVVRNLLDLSSMTRTSYVFDACYAVLLLVVGLAEIVTGSHAVFGYASVVLAIVWSLAGFYRYKKRPAPPVRPTKTLGFVSLVSFVAFFFILMIALNENVLNEATSSVSGSASSLMLCAFTSQRIPTNCTPVPDDQKERVITAIRQAHAAQTPSHGKQQRQYVLKIMKSENGRSVTTKCFVLVEYEDFESSLYLLPIETGKNCTGETFKYAAGSIRLQNFLRPANQ